MAPDQAAPVPPGWYPDPYAVSELRWWDGQNWTDSVHPPAAAPQPAGAPAASEPAASVTPEAAPVEVAPIVPAPVEAAPVEAAPVEAAPVEAAPVEPAPAAPVPTVSVPTPQIAGTEPATLVEPAHADGLPSRRELRARAGSAADSSEPARAPGVTATAPPAAPVPDSSEPSSFDWLPGGAALGTGVSVSAAAAQPAAEPTTPVAPPVSPTPSGLFATQAQPPTAAEPMPAANAWAQEPAAALPATDDLYTTAATRKATVSGWFIALMPLFAGILSIAAVKGAENYPRYIPATFEWWMLAGGVVVVLYLVTILLAVADRSKLDWAGYSRPAHWAWTLLTAPVYLLVRTIAVKRETGRNSALLWVWLLLAAALVGAWFAVNYFLPELLAPYTLPFL